MKIHRLYFLGMGVLIACLYGCDSSASYELNKLAIQSIPQGVDSVNFYLEKSKKMNPNSKEELGIQTIEAIQLFGKYKFDSGYASLKSIVPVLKKENPSLLGYAYSFMGRFHRIKNQMDNAIYFHAGALKLLDQEKDKWFIQANELGLALAYNKLGRYEESIPHYKKTLQYKDDAVRTVNALIGLSDVYRALAKGELALSHGKEAQKIADAKGKKYLKSVAYEAVANSFAILDRPDSSLYYMEQVLDLLKGMPSHLSNYSGVAGVQAYHLKNFDKAEFHLKNSIHLANDNHSQSQSANFLYLARTFLAIGKLDSCLSYAKIGLTYSRGKGEKPEQLQLLELHSEVYETKGQLDSSLFYLQAAKELQQEIFNGKLSQEVTDLRVEVETLAKEKELQAALVSQVKSDNQRNFVVMLSGSLLILLGLYFFRYRRNNLIKQELLESEKKALNVELERNKQLLSTQTLNMIHKNNGFSEIAENLKEVNGTGRKIKQIIDINMALEKDWDNFNLYFSQVHSDFYDRLSNKHPSLSVNDKRLCALVKMGLKNKEISSILNIKYESINMAKYRLKKKMELPEETDVNEYVSDF